MQSFLRNLKNFYEIFKYDPMLDANSGIKEFSVEYFIISIYMLIRHMSMYYVFDDAMKSVIKDFVYDFHQRWKNFDDTVDNDLLKFSNNRQQGEKELEVRDQILRHIFFQYLKDKKVEIISKDKKRVFSELERLTIYRHGKGLCQVCLREEKPEDEARVSWTDYQADHVLPHSKGGQTVLENSELLCAYHNQSKGAKV